MEKFKKFALKPSEMKSIVGGIYRCQCDGGNGTWTGNYKNQEQADRAAAFWCANASGGGTCK